MVSCNIYGSPQAAKEQILPSKRIPKFVLASFGQACLRMYSVGVDPVLLALCVKTPLLPIPVEGAFDRLAVNCLGPYPECYSGNRYVVVFSDH